MRDAATGKSRGFAFLTFADPNVVDEVASRHHQLDGKNVGKLVFLNFFFWNIIPLLRRRHCPAASC